MQLTRANTFISFEGARKPRKKAEAPPPATPPAEQPAQAPLPAAIEKRLQGYATQFSVQLEELRGFYRFLKESEEMKDLKLTEDQIFESLEASYDPAKRKTSQSLQETGGWQPPQPAAAARGKTIEISEELEKKLAAIAKRYKADVEKAKSLFKGYRSLSFAHKYTDEQILDFVANDLNPRRPKMTTQSTRETGWH
jgi:hypothetical protein